MKPFRFEIKNKKIIKRKVNIKSNFNNNNNPIYNPSLFSSINIIIIINYLISFNI